MKQDRLVGACKRVTSALARLDENRQLRSQAWLPPVVTGKGRRAVDATRGWLVGPKGEYPLRPPSSICPRSSPLRGHRGSVCWAPSRRFVLAQARRTRCGSDRVGRLRARRPPGLDGPRLAARAVLTARSPLSCTDCWRGALCYFSAVAYGRRTTLAGCSQQRNSASVTPVASACVTELLRGARSLDL